MPVFAGTQAKDSVDFDAIQEAGGTDGNAAGHQAGVADERRVLLVVEDIEERPGQNRKRGRIAGEAQRARAEKEVAGFDAELVFIVGPPAAQESTAVTA